MNYSVELEKVLNLEGKYSNHPSDSGGKTMYGITERVARKYGYDGIMAKMSLKWAKYIYFKGYWEPLELDEITKLCPSIVSELFDTGVNQGVGRAAEYLQISLNALNRRQKDYNDIKIDGDIGPATLSALKAFCYKRKNKGDLVLLRALNCLQGAFYINLTRRREKDEDFLFGWLLNRIHV